MTEFEDKKDTRLETRDSTTDNIIWHYSKDTNSKISITGAESLEGDITFPSFIDGYPVVSIDSRAFINFKNITSITIPGNITSIGGNAFLYCSNLESVTIEEGVENIGLQTFAGCRNLRSINIPNSIKSIRNGAFTSCPDELFDTTTFPGLKLIDGWVISSSENINETLNLTGIRGFALGSFANCKKLVNVTIPNTVKEITANLFNGCSNLSTVTLKDGISIINSSAFSDCTNLRSINIPNSVKNIGHDAFSNCPATIFDTTTFPGLKLIDGWVIEATGTLPAELDLSSVRGIAGNVFRNHSELTSVILPENLKYIDDDTFGYCTGLTSITIPNSVEVIGARAFKGCTNLANITFPNNLVRIREQAFSDCTNIRSLTLLSHNIKEIGSEAFGGCKNIKEIYISDINDWFNIDFGSFPFTNYTHKLFANNEEVTDLVTPSNILYISQYAFQCCSSLTSLTISSGPIAIGWYAFWGCINLKRLIIEDGITDINWYAFQDCYKLEYARLPATLTSVQSEVFNRCEKLETVEVPDGVKIIGHTMFDNCTSLKNISIPDSVTEIGAFAFFQNSALEEINLSPNMDIINRETFCACVSLNKITIPEGITTIGPSAFTLCLSLSSIKIPDSVTTIQAQAFNYCSSLESIILPLNITTIESEIFINCENLKTIYYYRRFLEPTREAKQRIYNLLNNCGHNRDELEYICLNPEDDEDLYKKNFNEFSFVDTAADLAVNRDFVTGYLNMKSGKSDESTVIWEALSAIGDNISKVLYENVLNYIQDVSDINTCAVKSVCSMSKMVGTENYVVMDELSRLPREILDLLDVFSIKREYLLERNVFNTLTKNFFNSEANIELSANSYWVDKVNDLSTRASAVSSTSIDSSLSTLLISENWKSLVSSVFSNKLQSKINIEYAPDDFVYNNLSSKLVGTTWEQFSPDFLDDPYRDEIIDLKINLKVPGTFNPFAVADDIYFSGKEFESDSGSEKTLVDKVLECRARQKFDRLSGSYVADRPETKYAWYKEREFYDYLTFVHDQYASKQKNSPILSAYMLDATYNELSLGNTDSESNVDLPSIFAINDTAELLTKLALGIADVREQVKIQAQKNHMRGTFVLISYLINQYLTKNIPMRYPALSGLPDKLGPFKQDSSEKSEDIKIQLQEYEDNTEYYNLMTKTTSNAKERGVNARFWELEDDTEGIAFSEIDEFYLDTLNLKHSLSADEITKEKNPRDFLDIIYDIGADISHLDPENKRVVIPGLLADEATALEVDKHPELSAEYYTISALQRNLYLTYTGNIVGFAPERNFKNTVHSSYQIHPYLWKFTEYDGLKSSIENSYYNSVNEDMIKILMTKSINEHIGKYGNNLNVWKDDFFDFSGYKSRYENGWHSEKNGILEHYDGLWYPDAIEEYMLRRAGIEQVYESPVLVDRSVERDATEIGENTNAFKALLYSVYYRKTASDLLNNDIMFEALSLRLCDQDIIMPGVSTLNTLYKAVLDWNDDVNFWELCCLSARAAYDPEDYDTISSYNNAVSCLAKVKAAKPETFYGKWYRTNISRDEAEYIANQLYRYSSDLEKIYNNESNFNIYRYGLDKYGNSILLYKKYEDNDSYAKKKNTPGDLWIRKNAHPIGFPAFDSYDEGNYRVTSWPQIRNSENNKLNKSLLENLSTNGFVENIYDFNITNSYKYMTLAVKNGSEGSYDNSIVYFVEPRENTSEYDRDNYEYKYSYTFRSYNELARKYDKLSSNNLTDNVNSIVKFSGFFNNETDILTIFSEYKSLDGNYIKNIGNKAFYNCNSLKSIENILGKALVSIGDDAFGNCYTLLSIMIPTNASIGARTFSNCYNLNTIAVADDNLSYSGINGVLYSKDNKILIRYPEGKSGTYNIINSTLSIGNNAFENCNELIAVYIPKNTKYIGTDNFYKCNKLESINVDTNNSVYASDDGVLFDKLKTRLIVCPDGKTGTYTIPNGTLSIHYLAFSDCKLSSITIPATISTLNIGTNELSSNILSLNVDPDNPLYSSIDGIVYSKDEKTLLRCPNGLSGEFTIPDNVSSIGDSAFKSCKLSSISIPNSVSNIEVNAFGFSHILSISIPESVVNLRGYNFNNCKNLKYAEIFGNISNNWNNSESPFLCSGIESVILSGNLSCIGNYMFSNCDTLKNVKMGNNIETICRGAFANCKSLSSIELGNNLNTIGAGGPGSVFSNCISLSNINIPNSVSSINGTQIFSNCGLSDITIPNSVITIGPNTFLNCKNLKKATLGTGLTCVSRSMFSNCSSLTGVTFKTGTNIKSINEKGFENCTGLTSITIPDGVIDIGDSAFDGCNNLKQINLPESISSIGDSTFCECHKLTSITIPNSVTELYDDAFYNCSSLTNVVLPTNLNNIYAAFDSCTKLTSIILPDNTQLLGTYAFRNCTKLKTIDFEKSRPIVNELAFYKCPVNKIKYTITEDEVDDSAAIDHLKNILMYAGLPDFSTIDFINNNS